MKFHETILAMNDDANYNPVHRQERIEAALEAATWTISHEIMTRVAEAHEVTQMRDIITEVLEEML